MKGDITQEVQDSGLCKYEILQKILLEIIGENTPEIKEIFILLFNSLRDEKQDSVALREIFSKVATSKNLAQIIQACSLHNIILNICEEQERLRIYSISEHFKEVYKSLELDGFERDDCDLVLESIRFYPVFTAHPTESRRRTFLEAHREISTELEKIEQFFYTPDSIMPNKNEQITRSCDNIKYRLQLLWKSHLVRSEKLEVIFELDNLLYIVESSILPSALNLLNEIQKELKKPLKFSPIKLGSWIGGDRDGNPFVTNELMTRVIKIQHELIINTYISEINKLIRELSISLEFCKPSKRLEESLHAQSDYLNQTSLKLHKREPFRAKLNLMKLKLQNRLFKVNSINAVDFTYNEPCELLDDIDMLIESLDSTASQRLQSLRNLVLLGGFHLMQLDFREHRDKYLSALSEVLCLLGYTDSDFLHRHESKKIEILNKALSDSPINLNAILWEVSEPTRDTLNAFLRVLWAKNNISKDILKSFIVSMTTKASDLLCVLYLAYCSGLWKRGDIKVKDSTNCGNLGVASIFITPLFETIEDLENAEEILTTLMENPHYKQYLRDCNNAQQIMIGYSDSSKDGGIFTSNYSLYKAISNLMEIQNKLGIRFMLFHGKGGSISRGGGALEDALLALPMGSIRTTLKTTEQGEMISSKYLNPNMATRSFTLTLSSLLKKSMYDYFYANGAKCDFSPNATLSCDKTDVYLKHFEKLSQTSYRTYRNLVYESPNFMEYFKNATPIDFIQNLNLGSRPSKRSDTQRVEDLRAIPWVFAWTQNRSIIPAWYGLGSALCEFGDKNLLQECYQGSIFFRTTIDNIAQGLLKVDMESAESYNDFVLDSTLRANVWNKISDEYKKTLEWLLVVRNESILFGSNVETRERILNRMPNIKALSFLQIELIKKYKGEGNESLKEALSEQIHGTIIGIAQGIRNTG